MSIYEIQQCNDSEKWDEFVSLSPQGTRYCTDEILTVLGCAVDFWFVMRKGYPVAAVPVVTRNKASGALPMHAYYVGLMFHPEAWNCKANRRTENVISISGFVMEALSEHYDVIELCLHPDITDVRGFDWYNYHTPELGRVAIYPRYSARASLLDSEYREAARGSRRREEGYARSRENLHFSIDGTADELITLWVESFKRQDLVIDEIEIEITRRLAELVVRKNYGVIAVIRDGSDRAQAAGLLLLDHNAVSHLPVVGTTDTRYGGTLLYFSMMDYAAEQGYQVMDFNGANSPKRAYFKHSIGGVSRLYFHLRWSRPGVR